MSLKKNTLLNLVGAVVPIAVTLVTVPAYLKLIGPERFGTLAILWALMGYFGFMDLGLGRAVAQRLASTGSRSSYGRSGLVWTALIMTFTLGMLGGMVLWLSADLILSRWVEMTPANLYEAKAAVPWFVLAMPLIFSSSVLSGALHGRQRFIALNVLAIIGTTLMQVMPLCVAAIGNVSLNWLVPAALSARVVTFVISFYYCRRAVPMRVKPHFQTEHVRPLFSYGGWVSIISILAPLLVTIDRMVIGAMSGVKAVAFYTVPYGVVTQLMTISGSLHNAIFPRLAALEEREAVALVDRSSRALLAVMTFMALPVIALFQPFIVLWVGSEFAMHAGGVGEVLMFGAIINSIVIPNHAHLMARGKVRAITMIYLVEIPAYFLFLWVGLSQLGVLGAAVAWTARVLMDAVLLLKVSGNFVHAASYSLIPLTIGAAAVVVAILIPVQDSLRWYLICILIAFSAWYSRGALKEVLVVLLRRRESNSI